MRKLIIGGIRSCTVALVVLPLVVGPVSAQTASGSVSYLYEPLLSQVVEMQSMDEDSNIQVVPYEIMEDPSVLNAQSMRSPVSDLCTGQKLTPGKYVCSEFESSENVSNSSSDGITFRKECTINIALATYPAFFRGGDHNEDGRIEIYNPQDPSQPPEWASFSHVIGRTTPDVTYIGDYAVPSEEFHYTNTVDNVPLAPDVYTSEGTDRTVVDTTFDVEGENVQQQEEEGPEVATDDCEDNPPRDVDEPAIDCDSGINALDSTDDLGYTLMAPGENKTTARPEIETTTCPLVEKVRWRIACINAATFLQNPIFHIIGTLLDATCIVRNDCYENVHVYINTDSLLGTNEGCGEPCMDYTLDSVNAAMHPPDPTKSCTSNDDGLNKACWPDTYIGTPGICTVCGRYVGCTLVWKNWVKDNFDTMQAEHTPCDPDENPYCDWDEYWEYVVDNSGGLPAF